ncbi:MULTISPECIES: hypothetical protein [Kitasatospora]|uniref:CBM-cenC domain-containing protein n=1 Tax=Kitasatospora setae (strain ATCC 33774 / DSM 43861 / JCM 3304 / KCC A-0304 / NBRC 14216 / KM-6054) TaxID=452652 RepID=E4NIN8_KITSK|nr:MULTISPECIES: hypothetical protein [Kitasatospora]BAJ32836.1 hypothetical protein KSE_70790 [Kitasatospora setae KM-6054]
MSRPTRHRDRVPLGAVAATALLLATGGFAALGSGSAQAAQEVVRDGSFLQPLADNWTCAGDVSRTGQGIEGRPGGFDFAGCTQQVEVKPYTTYDLTADVSGAYAFVGVTGGEFETVSQWADGPEQTRLHAVVSTSGTTHTLTVYFHGWYGQGPYQVRRVSLYDSSTSLPACPDMTGMPPSSPRQSPPTPSRTSTPTSLAPALAQTIPPSPGASSPPPPTSAAPTLPTAPPPSSASPTWTGPTCLIPPSPFPTGTTAPLPSASTSAPRPSGT